MKKKIIAGLIPLLFCLQVPVFAAEKCIGFANYSSEEVEVGGFPDAGVGLRILPRKTEMVSGDFLGRPSFSNPDGKYDVYAIGNESYTLMRKIPEGSVIIYGGVNLYYVDKNPEVSPCQ